MMRSWFLALTLPAGIWADVLCDVRISERTVMLIDTRTGDEKYTASTLELQCNDVYQDDNGGTVSNAWPIYLQKCRSGMAYDKFTDSCGQCPDMGDSKPSDVIENANANAYWERCQPVPGADAVQCMCRYSWNGEDENGNWQYGDASAMVPITRVCSEAESPGECMEYVTSQESWSSEPGSVKMPEYQCTGLAPFAPSTNVGSIMMTPPLEKDSLYQLLRFSFADGVESIQNITKDWSLKENSVKLLFMSRISRSGQDLAVGPSLAELASNCQIKFNVYFDQEGTALNNDQAVAASVIPVYSPLCVADEVDSMKEFVANITKEMVALSTNNVTCNTSSKNGGGGDAGGKRRRLSDAEKEVELRVRDWEKAVKAKGQPAPSLMAKLQFRNQVRLMLTKEAKKNRARKLQKAPVWAQKIRQVQQKKRRLRKLQETLYVVKGVLELTATETCEVLASLGDLPDDQLMSIFIPTLEAIVGKDTYAANSDSWFIMPDCSTGTNGGEFKLQFFGNAGPVSSGDSSLQTAWYDAVLANSEDTTKYPEIAAALNAKFEEVAQVTLTDLTLNSWTVEKAEELPPSDNNNNDNNNGGDCGPDGCPGGGDNNGGDCGPDGCPGGGDNNGGGGGDNWWVMTEGMDCSYKREIVNRRAERLLQHAFVITGKDSWAGCKGFLDSWVIYGTQTKTKTTNKCTVSYEDNTGNVNPKWLNDPCCNWVKRQEMCCGPRTVEELITVVDDVNESNIALFSAATGSDTLALDLAMTYASAETEAAKSCFGPYKSFMDATGDVWKVVDECRQAVEGEWSETYNVQLGAKCTSDVDCYTGECYTPPANNRGGGSTSQPQKFCKTPDEMEVPNWGAATLTCLIDKSIPELKGRLAIRLKLPGSATPAQLAEKFLAEPGMQRAECRGHDNPWNRWTEEDCLAPKSCNYDGSISNETECLNPCSEGDLSCSSYCGEGDWEVSQLPFCIARINDNSNPWDSCWQYVQTLQQQWQDECRTCQEDCQNNHEGHCDCHESEGPCDYWRKEEAARRECMDDYCGRYCSGGECATLHRWDCIYPTRSFLDNRKADCLSECSATGGPNPVAPKSCRGVLNQAAATEDVCWKLGQGWIDVHYSEYHNWDWSRGPPPPESCVIRSYEVLDGKPYVPPPPYGPTCLPECENELDSCIENPKCYNWMESENKPTWQVCEERFAPYRESFKACLEQQRALCSGVGCMRMHRACRVTINVEEDPLFKEIGCGDCDGEWSSRSSRQMRCAEELSVAACRWNVSTMYTASQTCAPSCMHEVCEQAFSECQIEGGSLSECNNKTIAMNQCRECNFISCSDQCNQGACDVVFGGRDQAYRECAACDDTQTCNPASTCYGNNADSSCNWRWQPEFGYSCPILCEESIRLCENSVRGFCWEWDEVTQRSKFDLCFEEYDQYRQTMETCIQQNMPSTLADGEIRREHEIRVTLECAASVLPADWECAKCDGEWNSWSKWTTDLGPKCISGETTFDGGKTVPASCSACLPRTCPEYPINCQSRWYQARNCHWDEFGHFKICSKSADEAKTEVVASYAECADCRNSRCEFGCMDTTCANLMLMQPWDRMVAVEQCGGCPSTAMCHPGAECFISDTVAFTEAERADSEAFKAKFQPLKDEYTRCTGLSLSRRLEETDAKAKAPQRVLPVPMKLARDSKLEHTNDLEGELVALWREGNRLRNQGRNKRQQLQFLGQQTIGRGRMHVVLQRRALLENEHKALEKRFSKVTESHAAALERWQQKGGIVDSAVPPHHPLPGFKEELRPTSSAAMGRRLQKSQPEMKSLSCTGNTCTEQENLCTAFFSGRPDQTLVDSLVTSYSFAVLPWENEDQICQSMAQLCFISIPDAKSIILGATYDDQNQPPWVDSWCSNEDMTQCDSSTVCSECATEGATSESTCASCCRCYANELGFNAKLKHEGNPNWRVCDFLGQHLRTAAGNKNQNIYLDLDQKLLGGAGACIHHPDIWALIPDVCHDPACYQDKACADQCDRPEATINMCPSYPTVGWSFFKSTREWREGTLSTQSTCEVESCYPQPWIRTQEECSTVSHCESDCPYCETDMYWDWENKKTKVKCSFVSSTTDKPLSEADCQIACGGSFTSTCYYIKDSKGTGEACITEPPTDGAGTTTYEKCTGQKTLTGATVTTANYELLQCGSFTTEQCGWAETTFGSDMDCRIKRLQCKNKADCATAGRCDYEWDDWQIQENKGLCGMPTDFSGDDAYSSSRDFWGDCMNKGGEHRSWGCLLREKITKADCEGANARWFNWAPNKAKCEVPGYAWKKDSSSGAWNGGTMACCIQLRGSKTEGRCEVFTQDENSTSCEHCGGHWMSIFKFRSHGRWVEGQWKKNYKWTARAFEPSNKWVTRIAFEKVTDVWQNLIAAIRAVPATNFVSCRINPTLDTLAAIAKQTGAQSTLGTVPLLPATASATQVGDYIIEPFDNSVTGSSEVDVQVNLVSAGAVVAENAANGTNGTNTTGGARRQRRLQGQQGLQDSLTASCYTVVQQNTRYIGQLTGDCMVFNPSTTLDNPVQVCLPVSPQIPVYPAFDSPCLVTVNNGVYEVFPITVTASSDQLSLCASLSASGIYCPGMMFGTGEPDRTAPSGCASVTQISDSVVSEAAILLANGPVSLPGLVKIGEDPTSATFQPPSSFIGASGTVASKEEFASTAQQGGTGTGGTGSTGAPGGPGGGTESSSSGKLSSCAGLPITVAVTLLAVIFQSMYD